MHHRCWPKVLASVTLAVSIYVSLPGLAIAAEPPADPVLRIESGMHTATIRRIATDTANRYLVTGSDDKTVKVWDLTFYLAERVKELTQGRQTPVNPSPEGVPDFPIAVPTAATR